MLVAILCCTDWTWTSLVGGTVAIGLGMTLRRLSSPSLSPSLRMARTMAPAAMRSVAGDRSLLELATILVYNAPMVLMMLWLTIVGCLPLLLALAFSHGMSCLWRSEASPQGGRIKKLVVHHLSAFVHDLVLPEPPPVPVSEAPVPEGMPPAAASTSQPVNGPARTMRGPPIDDY